MKTTDLKDLLATVKSIRDERFPELDDAFLKAVVQAEDEYPEDDAGALDAIKVALDRSLAKRSGK